MPARTCPLTSEQLAVLECVASLRQFESYPLAEALGMTPAEVTDCLAQARERLAASFSSIALARASLLGQLQTPLDQPGVLDPESIDRRS